VSQTEVRIPNPDGEARAFTFHPDGAGPWPAVIFFMDGPAIRPALFQMCERLAAEGYFVLLPDMFWRFGPYEPIDVKSVARDEDGWRAAFGKMMGSTSPEKSTRDTGAFLDWLARRPEVKGPKVGCTGYCMGGGMALRAAGNFPGRIVAAASFHGGRLATDAPDSPHLLAPQMQARVYVGGADNDASFPLEQADRLRAALDGAGVENTVEIYPGALHGFAPPDIPAYDEAASERHWRELLKLLGETLKGA
jgi:carboxymethylenebutenolidase